MRLLITGAAGMLGRDLTQAALDSGEDVIALPRAELDIADRDAVDGAVRDARPEVVVNCAAYTNVDGAEQDPASAHAVNGDGAGNVGRAAAAAGAWTIHVSTDYVFDGTKRDPYLESDPTGPRSVYGASKLAGEQALAAAAPESHTIVRTSWLFGIHGPCFPATILRLAGERDHLSVVDDQVGAPTFTGHLARALLDLARQPLSGIVHVAGGGQCSWYEFARAIVDWGADGEVTVNPCTTAEFPRPAPRPAYSVLRTERGSAVPVLPAWQEGLRAYLSAGVRT